MRKAKAPASGAYPANRVEDKSLLLAHIRCKSFARPNAIGAERPQRAAGALLVLRTAQMPAILLEGGYMSNPVEGKRIFDADGRKQMAAAIVRAIVNYQKLTAPPPPPVNRTECPAPGGFGWQFDEPCCAALTRMKYEG